MAAPNIVNVATITAKSAVANVTTVFSNLVVNATSSGKAFKVNALYITNVDGTATANVSVGLNRGGYSYALANTVSVPADAVLDLISKSIYLEEGDFVQIKADANNGLHAVCSFEELS